MNGLQGKLATLAVIILFACTIVPAQAADTSPLSREHEALEKFGKCPYCIEFGDAPQAGKRLDDLWAATEDWVVAYFNDHPDTTAELFNTVALNMAANGDVQSTAIKLGPRLYAIGINYGEAGDIFIVGIRDNRFSVLWDIRNLEVSETHEFPVLMAWSGKAGPESCGLWPGDTSAELCSPLHGYVGILPRDEHDAPRFFVDATFASEGETLRGQLSIWTWTGNTAKPLLAKNFSYMIEDVVRHFDGRDLHIRQKDEFRTVYVTEPEVGRQMDWTIRITPHGVQDLGATPTVPELDFVDYVLSLISLRKSTVDVAAPAVTQSLEALIPAQIGGKPDATEFGWLMDSAVIRNKAEAKVCFIADGFGSFVFTCRKKGRSFFISEMKSFPDDTDYKCKGKS